MSESMLLQKEEDSHFNAAHNPFTKKHLVAASISVPTKHGKRVKSPFLLNCDADCTSDEETDFMYIPRYVKCWRWCYNWAVYLLLSSSFIPGISFSEASKEEYYYSNSSWFMYLLSRCLKHIFVHPPFESITCCWNHIKLGWSCSSMHCMFHSCYIYLSIFFFLFPFFFSLTFRFLVAYNRKARIAFYCLIFDWLFFFVEN